MLNGKKIYFGGDNIYYLGINTSFSRDDTLVAGCATKGVTVIRMWAFYNNDPGRIQPSLGVYTESALRQLDYAINDAETHGQKVILTLNNYWNDFYGMQWYVDSVEGPGHPETDFYTNAGCQTAFKNYINMLVNRTNFYTGVVYKNDPGIFAWELANEPRCPSDTTGTTLYNWVDMMGGYIKSLDPNHMVSTGEEGFKTGGNGGDWTENGSTGNDFARNLGNVNIDFATVHLYPTGWGKDANWTNAFLTDRASIAHNTAHKPIVLEEYGEETATGNRDSLFTAWHALAQNATLDYDGLMPWQMEDIDSNSFTYSFGSSTGTITGNMAAVQASKCEGATPVVPAAPTGAVATAGYLSVGLSWAGPFNATSYKIYRGTTAGGESATALVSGLTSTTYTDTGLTNGVTYYYKISAVNSVGEGPKSAEVSATANTTVTTVKYDFEGTLSGWTGAGMTGGPYFTNDWAAHGANSAKIDVDLTNSASYYMNCVANDDFSAYSTLQAVVRNATWGIPSGLWAKLYIKTGSTFQWFDSGGVNINSSTTGTVLTMNLAGIPNLNQIKEIGIQYGTFSSGNSGSTSLYVDYVTLSYSGTPGIPSPPTGLVASPGNTQIGLTWTASSGATSYNISRSTTSGGPYTSIATGVTATSYTNTGLTNGTTYYYVVSASNASGNSANSSQVSATPAVSVPSAPTGLAATGGNAQAALTWSASSGATSYNIYRGTTAGGESGTAIATGVTGTSYTNTGLQNGTTYYYKVAAVNTAGTSGQSNEASATPASGIPAAPAGLSAQPGNAQVALTWNTSTGATTYNVYRGTTAGGESGTAIATGITGTSYTNTGLTNGTTYYYKVAALNASGTSGMSNEASAKPAAATATVTFVKSDTTTKGTWKGVYGMDGYNVVNDTSSNNPSYPAYATVSTTAFNFTWAASTVDARALTWAATGATNRIAAQWNSSTSFTIDCNLTDANTHTVALYCLDWDGAGVRAESIQVQDFGTGAILNQQDVTAFQNGTWEVWTVKGHVKFVVTKTGGSNSAVSGIFFSTASAAPSAPTGLTATAGNTQASLAWTASSGATSYNVYRGTTAGGESATAIATGITATSYTNTGLTNGTTYYYKVAAVNANGTSARSNEASATPATAALLIKYDFDSTIVPWVGVGQSGGPNCAPEWQFHGPYSAQVGVNYSNNASYWLKNTSADNFSGYSSLKAVLHCGAGGVPSGLWGKLYIKTGPSLQWYDSGAISLVIGTTSTATINLAGVANANDIREIGVQWGTGTSGNSGSGLLNVDYITLQ